MVRGRWEPQKGRYWASKTNITFFIVWLTETPALKRRLFLQFHGKSMHDCGWSDGYTFFGMLSSEKWGWFFSLLDLRLAQDVFSRKVQQKRCYASFGAQTRHSIFRSTVSFYHALLSLAAPCGNAMRTYGEGWGSSWALDFQLTLLKTQVKTSWTLKLNRKKSNSNWYLWNRRTAQPSPAWIPNPQKFLRENKMVALLSSNVLG